MNSLPQGFKTRRPLRLNDSCLMLLTLCVIKIKFKPLSTGIENN